MFISLCPAPKWQSLVMRDSSGEGRTVTVAPLLIQAGMPAARDTGSDDAKPDELYAQRLRFRRDPGNDWIHMGVMIMH